MEYEPLNPKYITYDASSVKVVGVATALSLPDTEQLNRYAMMLLAMRHKWQK